MTPGFAMSMPCSPCQPLLCTAFHRQALCCCHAPNLYVHLNADSFCFWSTPRQCFTNKHCLLNKNCYGTFANSPPASFRLTEIPFLDFFFLLTSEDSTLSYFCNLFLFRTDLWQRYSSIYIAMKPWTLQQSLRSF